MPRPRPIPLPATRQIPLGAGPLARNTPHFGRGGTGHGAVGGMHAFAMVVSIEDRSNGPRHHVEVTLGYGPLAALMARSGQAAPPDVIVNARDHMADVARRLSAGSFVMVEASIVPTPEGNELLAVRIAEIRPQDMASQMAQMAGPRGGRAADIPAVGRPGDPRRIGPA
jgi:hypothetical protein